ncbi:MAG: energy transducer TonB [Bacteroidales bacterium]
MQKTLQLTLAIFLFVLYSSDNKLFSQENKKADEILNIVEISPEFPGGDEARNSFLVNNIVYPRKARKKGVEGIVYATFVVEKDGKISDVRILKGIGCQCDEEVIRVIKLMPVWKPGKQNGDAVRVQFNLPVKFTLRD